MLSEAVGAVGEGEGLHRACARRCGGRPRRWLLLLLSLSLSLLRFPLLEERGNTISLLGCAERYVRPSCPLLFLLSLSLLLLEDRDLSLFCDPMRPSSLVVGCLVLALLFLSLLLLLSLPLRPRPALL